MGLARLSMQQLLLSSLCLLLLRLTNSATCGITDTSWTQPDLDIQFCDDVNFVSTTSFYISVWPTGSTGSTIVHTTAVFSSSSSVGITANGTLGIDLTKYVAAGNDFYVSGQAGALETSSGMSVPAFRSDSFSMLVITTTTLESAGGNSEEPSEEDDDDDLDGDADNLLVPDVSIDLVESDQLGAAGGTSTWVKVLLVVGVALGVLAILGLGAYEVRQIAKRRARTRRKAQKELRKRNQDKDAGAFGDSVDNDLESPSPDSPPAPAAHPYKRSSSLHAFKMGIMQSTKSGRAGQTDSLRSSGSKLMGEAPTDSAPPILPPTDAAADAALPGQCRGGAGGHVSSEEKLEAKPKKMHVDDE